MSKTPYKYPYYSYVHDGFVQFTKKRVVKILKQYPSFDAITFPETMYPTPLNWLVGEYDNFADVSPAFQAAFKKKTGNCHFPNFTNPNDPHYFQTDKKLFEELLDFRVKTIVHCLDEIINGECGIRQETPNVMVGLWSLGISNEDGGRKLMEVGGEDPEVMSRVVQPDFHYIQTHAPDWLRGDLPPDYIKSYKPFLEAIKKGKPDAVTGFQFDIGSEYFMIKTQDWYDNARKIALELGFDTTTYYEFRLRGAIAFDEPEIRFAIVDQNDLKSIKLIFDQRIDPKSTSAVVGRKVSDFNRRLEYKIDDVSVDGNILVLTLARPVKGLGYMAFPVGGVSDDPSVRYEYSHYTKTIPDEKKRKGRVNSIPEHVYCFAELSARQ